MSTRPKNDFVTKLAGRLGQRMLKLPPAVTREVTVERDIPITVEDGVTLLADHWAPAGSAGIPLEQLPTVVVRTAYGPGGPLGWMYGRAIAERGMHVLMVRSRGTFGSGGTFLAMRHEREDGLATLRWLADQPWARGGVVLAGSSYFGYTQWAV
ncbi:CocE/NonD family hydrolase, partial [Micromonospora sp. DH15]|nr:CocE/NonD family hydrolase [Micromonospora sp. DH15]